MSLRDNKSDLPPTRGQGPAPGVAEVFTVLRAWLMGMVSPDIPVFQARQANVPPPRGDYVLMSLEAARELCHPARTYADGHVTVSQIMVMDFILTLAGDAAAEMAQHFATQFLQGPTLAWFRSQDAAVSPMDLENPERIPQPSNLPDYTPLWRLKLQFQVTQSVTTVVETALAAEIRVVDIIHAE